jgi:hypothetical protein
MLIIVCTILYGGTLYYVSIAQKWDMAAWFYRFRMGMVVTVWQRGPEGRLMVGGGFILFLMLFPAIGVGFGGGPAAAEPEPQGVWVESRVATVLVGDTQEGATDEAFPDLDHLDVLEATLRLEWNDDDASAPGPGITPLAPVNQPDTFRVTVTLADGTQYSDEGENDLTSSHYGSLIVTVPRQQEGNLSGWVIDVECVEAGDVVGTLGRVWATDDGNAWSLIVDYTHLEWVATEPEAA